MFSYRTFRNGDPPRIRELWNTNVGVSRGFGWLQGADNLEALVFSKPYFDPRGLQLALVDGQPIGLALSGFSGGSDGASLDTSVGSVCLMYVHPHFRGQGVGTELMRRSLDYLRSRGAKTLYAGAHPPVNAFGMGMYGGSGTPGVLESDVGAVDFLRKRGFTVADSSNIFQVSPDDEACRAEDPRLPLLRRKVRIFNDSQPKPDNWWQACVGGAIMTYRYEMVDFDTNEHIAAALVWEMEYFGWAWKARSFGMTGLTVVPNHRRRGFGKLLLQIILKHLQDNRVGIVEAQLRKNDLPGKGLLESRGFKRMDTGLLMKLDDGVLLPAAHPSEEPNVMTDTVPPGDLSVLADTPIDPNVKES